MGINNNFIVQNGKVVRYTGKEREVEVPNSINGETITSIEKDAFKDCNFIKKIILPDTLLEIKKDAFQKCEDLKYINLPNSLKHIEERLFDECDNLKYNEYNDGYYLGDDSNPYFYFKEPRKKGRSEITFHPNCKVIGYRAFKDSGLKSVSIPNSIELIAKGAFEDCEDLKSVELSTSITSIEEDTFKNCKDLKSITIPDSVLSIGKDAFKKCESLKSIVLSKNLKYIGKDAFQKCEKLKELILPDSLTSVSERLLDDCDDIKYNYYEKGNYIGSETNSYFYLASSKTHHSSHFEIHPNCKIIGCDAFNECGIKSIIIPIGIICIGSHAFKKCEDLKYIYIPSTVKEIGHHAFEDCEKITICFEDSNPNIDIKYCINKYYEIKYGISEKEYLNLLK